MPVGVDTYTKLLIHGNGSDGATTFRDASSGHKSISVVGSAQVDTAQSVFGGASIYLPTNSCLTLADSADWYFGTGDFTIDCWVRYAGLPGDSVGAGYVGQIVSDSNYWFFGTWKDAGSTHKLRFAQFENGSLTLFRQYSWATIATNTWYHVAVVRTGNTFIIFLNGVNVSQGDDTDDVANFAAGLYIGRMTLSGHYLNGWLDEVRVSKGIARWTTDFTPPTDAYWLEVDEVVEAVTTHDEASGDQDDTEVDSSTVLLLHGEGADASTTIKDSSATHRAVSVYGNAQIDTAQKKFGSASILFDGVSDAVYCADSDDWYLGTEDFTIDWWVRFSSLPAAGNYAYIIGQRVNDNNRWNLLINNNSGTYRMILTVRGSQSIDISRNFSSLSTETWYHMAITRAGSSFKMFLDGNQLSTEYITGNTIDNFNTVLTLGSRYSDYAWPLNGWLDEVRLIKGKAIWTASFTVPTTAYAILDHRIEHVTTSEDLVTDPGLPTDADFTDGFTTDDYLTLIAGLIYEGDIDEDILAGDTFTPNQVHTQALVDGTAQMGTTVVSGSAVYNKSITDALTTAETIDAQFNITMHGAATFPLFETAAYTGLGFNSGDMNFPVFEGIAYAGARSSIQEIPKFGLSGTMQIQYPFGQAAKHPKFSCAAAMTVGKVANGDADFPLFSGTGTMIGNPQVTGDVNFPVFGGNGGMSVGGRFANYVLRYVR